MIHNYKDLFKYKIIYTNKRRKTISFKIIDDVLNVTSPKKVSEDYLLKLIEKKEYSILFKFKTMEPKREIHQNNTILFLGKELTTNIKESDLLSNGGFCVLSSNNILNINISMNYDNQLLEKIIKKWYVEQCEIFIQERVKYFATKYNFNYKKISIKERKSVWGTCNIHNDLVFNWKIITFQPEIIDYLIVHELSHTVHKNHSKLFWNLVKTILPNYKELDKQLKHCKIK